MNVHLHCIACNLKRVSKCWRCPPGKISADVYVLDYDQQKSLLFQNRVIEVTELFFTFIDPMPFLDPSLLQPTQARSQVLRGKIHF